MRFTPRLAITYVVLLTLLFWISACDSSTVLNESENGGGDDGQNPGWLIPRDQVRDGGPGKDGIPSIDNPQFQLALNEKDIEQDDLVLGVRINGRVRAYPHFILDYHEIVNDVINDFHFAVTYCPLTATGIVWNRTINDTVTTFGVSGLLYKNNLIPYDRMTDSNWSQMLNKSVKGDRRGRNARTVNVIETTWETWLEAYPNSRVMTRETGYPRNYDRYPYGDYKNNHDSFLFPVENKDDRLPAKQRVHMIEVDSAHVVYPIKSFPGDSISVINTWFQGQPIVVFGNREDNIVESYSRRGPNGNVLNFEPVNEDYPVVMKDQQGNRWDLFGRAVEGPMEGQQLQATDSYNGYWFAIADFFPETEIRRP